MNNTTCNTMIDPSQIVIEFDAIKITQVAYEAITDLNEPDIIVNILEEEI